MVSGKKIPLVSVIIPTFNEEKWLPKLLECLRRQTFRNFEIIVADNHSIDATRDIAKRYSARIVQGGLPSKGRNNGAKVARGKIFFFVDADVRLPKDFLEKVVYEFQKKHCDIATTFMVPYSDRAFDKVVYGFFNATMFLFQFFLPLAHGFNIVVSRKLFKSSGGFDESLIAGEDFEFTMRVSKGCKFRVLSSTKNLASVRRFDKIGRLKHSIHIMKTTFRTFFLGQKLKSKEDYDWSGYNKKRNHSKSSKRK